MRLLSVGLVFVLAFGASSARAASATDPREARVHTTWYPSDRLWSGALPAQGCGARAIEPTGGLALAAPMRRATFERRGELIAELRGSGLQSYIVRDKARSCAARAADAATAPAILTAAVEPLGVFHGALAACLRETGAAREVGSMTLWIDTSCNW